MEQQPISDAAGLKMSIFGSLIGFSDPSVVMTLLERLRRTFPPACQRHALYCNQGDMPQALEIFLLTRFVACKLCLYMLAKRTRALI